MRLQGVAVFLLGNALQLHSHALLARLGGGGARPGAAPRYRIPRGGAFRLVSCPHYAAEILIYLGLAAVVGPQNAAPWWMVAWVVSRRRRGAGAARAPLPLGGQRAGGRRCRCAVRSYIPPVGCFFGSPSACILPAQVANLALAAGLTHTWYRRRFKTYPPARRALVPYLY